MDHPLPAAENHSSSPPPPTRSPLRRWPEDRIANVLGLLLLAIIGVLMATPPPTAGRTALPPAERASAPTTESTREQKVSWSEITKRWISKPAAWERNPVESIVDPWRGILHAMLITGSLGLLGGRLAGRQIASLIPGIVVILLLATVAYVLSSQKVIKHYNLEFPLWAILVGLIISNTIGTPGWLRRAAMGELYVKLGLVLLGAEILIGELMKLGLPGILISWVVTPIVLIGTFWFGQRILKLDSPALNMVISADMSVCGVSAAIATSAACNAKKEELALAIGLSLAFTAVMMVALPPAVTFLGLGEVIGGAWIGGTIDSTGAVAAAGASLGETALKVATTVKLIQNILIGVIAVAVAAFWTRYYRAPGDNSQRNSSAIGEIWSRFPKFILGFFVASCAFSFLARTPEGGEIAKDAIAIEKELRGWLFCLAFVSIGLDTNFRHLAAYFARGKPMILYLSGQALNLMLTLLMAYFVFTYLFPDAAEAIRK